MKPRLIALAFVLGCSVSAAAGYWFGFREAWYLGVAADFLPRGSIATYQLKLIRADKPDNVITGLEFDVDNGLLWGHELFHHPLRNYLNPVWGLSVYPEYEQYATRLADYRINNPSLMKPDTFDKVPEDKQEYREFYKDLAQGAKENIAKIKVMTEKYATKQ